MSFPQGPSRWLGVRCPIKRQLRSDVFNEATVQTQQVQEV